ncbi:hypothetical protein HF259_28975 [Rhizobium leguminosarum]|nr:hypothetical protein [Rhizobium leguminosarum]
MATHAQPFAAQEFSKTMNVKLNTLSCEGEVIAASARDGTKASKWEFLPTGTNHIDTTESSADRLRPSAVAADIDTLWQSALRSGGGMSAR